MVFKCMDLTVLLQFLGGWYIGYYSVFACSIWEINKTFSSKQYQIVNLVGCSKATPSAEAANWLLNYIEVLTGSKDKQVFYLFFLIAVFKMGEIWEQVSQSHSALLGYLAFQSTLWLFYFILFYFMERKDEDVYSNYNH